MTFFLLMMLCGMAVSGCAGTESENTVKEESSVISIPIIFTVDPTTGKKNNQELADAFNKAYTGKYHLDVEWVLETEEEYRQNLRRMNVTDSLPAVIYDVCTIPSFYMMMVEEGRLEDLSPYLEEDLSWKTNIEPFVLQGSTYADGKVYLGPISTSAFTCAGMFWNEDLFAQAGIDRFPETWEEFWECCDTLKEHGITPLALHTEGTGWAPMLIATAALAESKEGAEFMRQMLPESYDNESGLYLGEVLQKAVFLIQQTMLSMRIMTWRIPISFSDKAAMIPNGYWLIDQIPENRGDEIRFFFFSGAYTGGIPGNLWLGGCFQLPG